MGNNSCLSCDKSSLGHESVLNYKKNLKSESDQNDERREVESVCIIVQKSDEIKRNPSHSKEENAELQEPKKKSLKEEEIGDGLISQRDKTQNPVTGRQNPSEQLKNEEEKEEEAQNSLKNPESRSSLNENVDFDQVEKEKNNGRLNKPSERGIGSERKRSNVSGTNASQQRIGNSSMKSESRIQGRDSSMIVSRENLKMKGDNRKKKALYPNEEEDAISENIITLDKPMTEESVKRLVKVLRNHYTFSRLQNDEM